MSKRISKDDYYLRIAEAIAIRSTCVRHKYGAVIVNDDIIVSTGYNGAPRGEPNCIDGDECYMDRHTSPVGQEAAEHGDQWGLCVAVHAEQNAMLAASRKDLKGSTLYLACLSDKENIGPCNICDRMIKNAGIARVRTKGGMTYET